MKGRNVAGKRRVESGERLVGAKNLSPIVKNETSLAYQVGEEKSFALTETEVFNEVWINGEANDD